jgi:hypothetical protein
MRKLLAVIAILAIHQTLQSQEKSTVKISLEKIGKFRMGDNLSVYAGKLSRIEKGPDTTRFGEIYAYTGNGAVDLFGTDSTNTILTFCSGEMMSLNINCQNIAQDKILNIQKQLAEKNGRPVVDTTVRFPNDTTDFKRHTWMWRSGDNSLFFVYDIWHGTTSASILLSNSKRTMACLMRNPAPQTHP